MDKELLEVVLKKSVSETSLKRIIDMKLEPAVPKGENYTSTILRVTLKVVLGNGRIATKSFIMKKEIFSGGEQEVFKQYSLTKTEASIYTNVLREMDYLMEEFGDTEGPLWCKLIYFSQAESTVILEDLKASGFGTVKRTVLQDLDHARLALRGLGRYHAMAKILEDRGIVSKADYKPFSLSYDEVVYRPIVFGGLMALVKGMRASWGKEWSVIADQLSQITFEEFSKKVKKCMELDEDIFKCLNHGDFWNSNMMFKHNWEGKPIEIRFVDFQLPNYNTPCVDLIYYTYTSIKPDLRRQYYKNIVEFYHDSLITSLDRYGYIGSKPSLDEIEKNMERLSFFTLVYFISSHAVDSYDGPDGMDMSKVLETNGKEGFNVDVFSQVGIKEKIGEDIKTIAKKLQEN